MKKLLFLLVVFMMTMSVNAQVTFTGDDGGLQDEETSDFKTMVDKRKNVVSFGFKAGANLSTMSKYKEIDLGQKSGFGFEGGIVLAARFGKWTPGSDPGTGRFGVQIEPAYVQHTIGTEKENMKLSFFEIPVLLKIFLTPNLNIEVGPSICGTLKTSPDYIIAEDTRISIGDFKGFDIKGVAGISYETKLGLYASLRYNYGFSELAKNFPCKVSAASLTVGYKFNIFKF